jgi:hypothetical protein
VPEDSYASYRRPFIGSLVIVLIVGLVWALNPEGQDEPSVSFHAPSSTEVPLPPPPLEPTAPGPQKGTDQLAATALPPGQTTVQILDAGSGADRLQSAVQAARQLGYQVIATASARHNVLRTTVWFTAGNQDEAHALHSRDPRFAEVGPNKGLSSSVDLHVLVGPDWGSPLPPG